MTGVQKSLKERALTLLVPAVLTAVLIALALLQYRWSGQVSDAATTRIHAGLQNALMNFREDFSRSLTNMCLELQAEPGTQTIGAEALTQKLEHWKRTSPAPALVSDIYLWKPNLDQERVLHLVPPKAKFEEAAWPQSFEDIRQLLLTAGKDATTQPNPSRSTKSHHTDAGQHDFVIAGIDEKIPLVVVPSGAADSSWLLLRLDFEVLQRDVFAQLASRYLGNSGESSYAVAVVGDDSPHPGIIYSYDPSLTSRRLHPDASLNLFGRPEWNGEPQPVPVDLLPRRNSISAAGDPGFGPIRFDPIRSAQDPTDWRVVAQDKKGSVEATVASLRYRNLALSFGVLLLLGISMLLIIYTSQRARRLAALQMDFVTGVSHELRTPVAAILSISDNLADGVVHNQQQLERYGGFIRTQARQLNHLIEQVLRFSAVRNNSASYNIRALRISEVIAQVLENTGALIAASGFNVEVSEEASLPLAYGDFGALVQCVQNLVTNAIKYGGEKKWIGIRATHDVAAREVTIAVEDRGIGIDPHEIQHIFEPFYRSPKVSASQIHGTGLGLALACEFAKAMGGRLVVKSELGTGSLFTIQLRAAHPGVSGKAVEECSHESRAFAQ